MANETPAPNANPLGVSAYGYAALSAPVTGVTPAYPGGGGAAGAAAPYGGLANGPRPVAVPPADSYAADLAASETVGTAVSYGYAAGYADAGLVAADEANVTLTWLAGLAVALAAAANPYGTSLKAEYDPNEAALYGYAAGVAAYLTDAYRDNPLTQAVNNALNEEPEL